MNRTKIVSQGMVRRLDALSQAAVDFCKVLVMAARIETARS